jgi:CheY-like chemotaxis protein
MAYKVLTLTDSNGAAVGFATVSQDITERRRLEDDLRRLASDLSEADRRKDEFLATLAHELRNPLAPLRNALQVMRLTPDEAAREQARSLMERQIGQMVRLVDDLLDVSRITKGKLELRKEAIALSAALESAVETSRPLIDHMGHDLTVSLPDHPIVVQADLTRLAQVVANLLNNSAKYMDRGGRIWLRAERQGSDAVVTVRDAGIGIAPDQLPHLFQMFTQVEHSLERSQGGLGIGLTLVKRLVEMHGGSIEAKSEGPGKGAEFVVRLPVVVDACELQNQDDNGAPTPSKSALRILIVDDNRDSADSLAMLLRIMGNDTRTAYDGQQGVDAAEEFRPDVMLLDIGLPKLNGYEACRRIRETAWGKSVVLIAVTGWGQEEDRRRSHEAGFDHHMVKPVDPQTLMKLLADLRLLKPAHS